MRKPTDPNPPPLGDGAWEVVEVVGKNIPRPPGPGSLKTGDAPCALHPGFTRREACKARRTRRAPGGMELKRMVASLRVQGASIAEIAAKTGYAERYLARILKSDPDIQVANIEIATRAGATVEKAARTLTRQMDAKRSVVVQHLGEVTKVLEFEDNAAQIAAASKVGEWHGLGLGARSQKGGTGGPVMLNIQAGAKVEMLLFGEVTSGRRDDPTE